MNTLMNKKEQTYEIIKNRILRQEYPMGSPLNIRHISEELGISNSPVREALNMLEKEGLVVSSPNSVPKVVELGKEDMFEISQIVFFLVIGAYRFSVHRGRIEEISTQMEEVLQMAKKAFEDGDRFAYMENSIYFYRCLIEISGNKRLKDEFEHIYPLFYLCSMNIHRSDEDISRVMQNQENFIKALNAKEYGESIDIMAKYYYQDAVGGEVGL